jgi:Kdo2-lipid IVA lauroyltransferase/acyltransferase
VQQSLYDRSVNFFLRLLLGGAMWLSYPHRVRLVGWVTSRVIGKLAGYQRRARENLGLIFPTMPEPERARIAEASVDNAGRTMAEIFSGAEFIARARAARVTGPGMEAITAARAAGRPVILVSGHFGNFDVPRGYFAAEGVDVGGLYKPLANEAFNAAYVAAISGVNLPVFERGRRGLAAMVTFLKRGGMIGVLFDQRIAQGEPLDFLGEPALTALSAAEMALKYDALMVPVFGIRQPDGLSFELATEAPIAHADARTMMQAASDSLAARVRATPEQYFWIHRRWKQSP